MKDCCCETAGIYSVAGSFVKLITHTVPNISKSFLSASVKGLHHNDEQKIETHLLALPPPE